MAGESSPWAGLEEPFDPEALERLQPRALPRTRSLQEWILQQAADRPDQGHGLHRASSDLRDTMKSALNRTASFRSAVSRTSSAGAREVLDALREAASVDAGEAQVEPARQTSDKGGIMHVVARVLISLFFMDCCLADYQNWQFYQTPLMKSRVASYPHRYKDPGFPYLDLLLILPCAMLVIFGIGTRVAASILVLDMLWDSAGIVYTGLVRMIQHRLEPDELTVKHLAMLGSAALLLAHSVRGRHAANNTVAGLLLGDLGKEPGRVKSLVLLFSRLALAFLFVTVGIAQGKRVIQRDWALFKEKPEFLRRDGHDSTFLLLEALLAVPFALGYRTRLTAPLLALALLAEACWCWWPLESWPSVQYQSHVRSHFATNLGAAGGLLLMQNYGAGQYTIDKLMKGNKQL